MPKKRKPLPLIPDRIAAGEAWLDHVLPAGWDATVDLDRLDLSSGCDDVLGQIGAPYGVDYGCWTGRRPQHPDLPTLTVVEAALFGFTTTQSAEWPLLTATWRQRLADRQTSTVTA